MNKTITIRQETKKDRISVYNLIKETFKNIEYSNKDEHNLVERLRKSKSFIPELSLVAEFNKKIVGLYCLPRLK